MYPTARHSKAGSAVTGEIFFDQIEVSGAAELRHLLRDPLATRPHIGRGRLDAQAPRVGKHGGEQCTVGTIQASGILVKIALRRGLHAVGAAAEFDNIQVHLEYALLRPAPLDEQGQAGLQALAKKPAARPKE